MRKVANSGKAAVERLVQIEASLTSLDDENLLDLAHLQDRAAHDPGNMAFAEMAQPLASERCRRRDLGGRYLLKLHRTPVDLVERRLWSASWPMPTA